MYNFKGFEIFFLKKRGIVMSYVPYGQSIHGYLCVLEIPREQYQYSVVPVLQALLLLIIKQRYVHFAPNSRHMAI